MFRVVPLPFFQLVQPFIQLLLRWNPPFFFELLLFRLLHSSWGFNPSFLALIHQLLCGLLNFFFHFNCFLFFIGCGTLSNFCLAWSFHNAPTFKSHGAAILSFGVGDRVTWKTSWWTSVELSFDFCNGLPLFIKLPIHSPTDVLVFLLQFRQHLHHSFVPHTFTWLGCHLIVPIGA